MSEKLRKNKGFSSKVKAIWSKFLSFFRKGDGSLKTHSRFGAIVAFQYRDKVDLSWTKQLKTRIQKTVFFILKFALIAGAVFGILIVVWFV